MILYLYLLLFLKPWKIFFDSINDKRNKNNKNNENNENILVESNSFNENETDSINNTPSLSESIKVRYSLEKDINNSSKRSISEINQSIQEEENSNKKLKINTEESSELSTINQPKSPETPKTPELSYFKSDI